MKKKSWKLLNKKQLHRKRVQRSMNRGSVNSENKEMKSTTA
ncbi:MAG: hypothetical protein OHM56_02940 [Spiroplasma phoeniceum]|nr:MAG: hypothetical protein OHM57_02390 [Spiroplasma phoeniceum]UZQ32921.1 MAG: hypothetical protein OHM56_02940 [Spiroplasma phoeniceum]